MPSAVASRRLPRPAGKREDSQGRGKVLSDYVFDLCAPSRIRTCAQGSGVHVLSQR
jgi:hypothetical protein